MILRESHDAITPSNKTNTRKRNNLIIISIFCKSEKIQYH